MEAVPEEVTVISDALDFIDREIERARDGRTRTGANSWRRSRLEPPLLNVPLYDYQVRGALFLACRGRSILGDDMGLGKTIQTLAAVELLARERGIAASAGRRAGVGEVSMGDARSASSPSAPCR